MLVPTRSAGQNVLEGSRRSAQKITPILVDLVQPGSVIDIGCGDGAWLDVFTDLGVTDTLGVDGPWVEPQSLQIPKDRFLPFDLTKPFRLKREFDLVLCLEVAHYLPATCAETLVDSITRLGRVVVFSAAIPLQGGPSHVNEQWPSYWAELFHERGYVVADYIRKKIWQDELVEWWYAQNALLFCARSYLECCPNLKKAVESTDVSQLAVVHPRKYFEAATFVDRIYRTAQDITKVIPVGHRFVLIDHQQFGEIVAPGRYPIPFLECDGHYWGPPPDDVTARDELDRLRRVGATHLVFGWPAFWWLDFYADFHRYVRSQFSCLLENDRVIIFDLQND